MTTRVLIADDHTSIRSGLRMILEAAGFAVVGEASDGNTAVSMARRLAPDVVLMDIRMPGCNGIEATREIVAQGSSNVLILTAFDFDEDVLGAIRAGAKGYALKTLETEDLVRAVGAVAQGNSILDPDVAGTVMRTIAESSPSPGFEADSWPPPGLTPREVAVMECIGEGLTNRLIARKLGVAETTAKSHVSSALGKLQLTSRVEAAIYVLSRKH
jgi:DNA-binding NarL/FixJ family response regulator